MRRTIELTEQLNNFVEERVVSGGYSNADEVVREALQLMQKELGLREQKREVLARLIREGADQLDAGMGIVIDGPDELDEMFEEIHTKVEKELKVAGGQLP